MESIRELEEAAESGETEGGETESGELRFDRQESDPLLVTTFLAAVLLLYSLIGYAVYLAVAAIT